MKIHYDSCFTSIRYMQFVNFRAQRSPGRMPVYFWRHSFIYTSSFKPPLPWLRSLPRITYLSKLIGIRSLAALMQLE
ncbi:hypothetical protein BIU73_07540 [Escherichia coli]|nr:hypothetical protein BIU73_07540 [Escherichia coli]